MRREGGEKEGGDEGGEEGGKAGERRERVPPGRCAGGADMTSGAPRRSIGRCACNLYATHHPHPHQATRTYVPELPVGITSGCCSDQQVTCTESSVLGPDGVTTRNRSALSPPWPRCEAFERECTCGTKEMIHPV